MGGKGHDLRYRRVFEAASTDHLTAIEIYRRMTGNPVAVGYSPKFRQTLNGLVIGGFMKSECIGQPNKAVKRTTFYWKVKAVFYATIKNRRFNYLPYAELRPASKLKARAYYAETHAWLDVNDYL